MQKTWDSVAEFAQAIEDHVRCGHLRVVLTPQTAMWLAEQIRSKLAERRLPAPPRSPWAIDLYAKGSCVIEVDANGDVMEVIAWAANGLAANATFEYLCRHYPNKNLHQRRRSWVEAERMLKP